MQRKINNTVICLWMRKNLTAKTPTGDFQVTTPETPLLSQQAVISKRIPSILPTYSWTLTPIPNWTCSVVTVLLFDALLPSTWLIVVRIPIPDFNNTNWEDCWLQSSSVHPHNEDQEDAWSQNPTMQIHSNFFKRKRWTRLRTLSPVTICLIEFAKCLCNLCTVLRLLKQSFYMSRVKRKEGPKTDSQIPRKSELDSEILKPRQIGGVEKLSTSYRALMNLQSYLISWKDLKALTLDLETWFLEVFKHILSLPKYK